MGKGKPRFNPKAELLVMKLTWKCSTWGELEALAGITDRKAFWKGKNEDQAREALVDLVRERVRKGELCQPK